MTPPVVAPCPFCGREAAVKGERVSYGTLVVVHCVCGASIKKLWQGDAITAWNTRPRPAVVDPVIVERASEIIAVTMFDSQVFGMQSMKRCVVDAWEEQPKDAQESIRRQSRLIAEKILALTAALGATGPEGVTT